MLIWLFSAFVCINAASIPVRLLATPDPQACTGAGLNITLTPSGYTLPLTSFHDPLSCKYNFVVPTGYYASVDLQAYNLKRMVQVGINDAKNVLVENDYNKLFQNYSSFQSWPYDFQVSINTKKYELTQAEMALDIKVLHHTPNANIVKAYVTFAGTSSLFIYNNEWNDGESYRFISRNGKIYVLGGAHPESDISVNNNWNNVFVYEGGVFKGTLAAAVQEAWRQVPYISHSNEVILWCTKKVGATGAVMITDYSNIKGLDHNMEYVPKSGSYDIGPDSRKIESAFTVVSDRKNPANLTLDSIQQVSPGALTYISGGPIQNHSNGNPLAMAKPPPVITGSANTFYVSKGGYDVVWFKIN